MAIKVGEQQTFTVSSVPERPAQRKTIRRLMRMQPEVQNGLGKLSTQRQRDDNRRTNRAGRIWIARVKTTKLTHVEAGETFTIHVTPQIVPDIKSVEKFLTVGK